MVNFNHTLFYQHKTYPYESKSFRTAGAGGIGLEMVKAFVALGARVFVCDINAEALSELEKVVLGVETMVCDVSSRTDVEKMVTLCAGIRANAILPGAVEGPRINQVLEGRAKANQTTHLNQPCNFNLKIQY